MARGGRALPYARRTSGGLRNTVRVVCAGRRKEHLVFRGRRGYPSPQFCRWLPAKRDSRRIKCVLKAIALGEQIHIITPVFQFFSLTIVDICTYSSG